MDLDLRSVSAEEFSAFHVAVASVFGAVPTAEDIERWRGLVEQDRTLAAFEGTEIVGTAAALSFELTLPGGTSVPAAGVTAVGVRSTHTRRGVLRAMMDRQLDDVAERGEPVAVLTASESIIYGRFGYGLATSRWNWALETEGAVLARPSTAGGRMRLLDAAAAAEVVRDIYGRARLCYPGALLRTPSWWSMWARGVEEASSAPGKPGRFQVVHESEDGLADGFATWTVESKPSESGLRNGEIKVIDLYAVDDEVEIALWEYLLSIDLMRAVIGRGRPVEEPLRWRLADPRRMQVRSHRDHLWLRILDPGAALSARVYWSDERVVIGLDDPFRPGNNGNWLLEGGVCCRCAADPEITLGVTELGAVLLGGISPTALARAGRVIEETPGALRRADALFASPVTPWCGTFF